MILCNINNIKNLKRIYLNSNIIYKRCNNCKKLLLVKEFNKHKISKDSLQPKCKNCIKKYNNYIKNKPKIIPSQKKCVYCNEIKDMTEFCFDNRRNDGLSPYCKRCVSTSIYKKSYQNNRERRLKYMRKYNKSYQQTPNGKERLKAVVNKRRAKKYGNGGFYTTEQLEECLLYFNNKDCYTGKQMNEPSIDHIIPISKGGTTFIWNIVPCNRNINSCKKTSDLEEWYRGQTFFSEERLDKIYKWIKYAKNKYNEEYKYYLEFVESEYDMRNYKVGINYIIEKTNLSYGVINYKLSKLIKKTKWDRWSFTKDEADKFINMLNSINIVK